MGLAPFRPGLGTRLICLSHLPTVGAVVWLRSGMVVEIVLIGGVMLKVQLAN